MSKKHPETDKDKKCLIPAFLCKRGILFLLVILAVGGASAFLYKNWKSSKSQLSGDAPKSSVIDRGKSVTNAGEVEDIIAKWVEANPEAIIQSVANMQQKAMKDYEEKMKEKRKNIPSNVKSLLNDKNSPSYSPSGFTATVVEFFDYNCGYCKKAQTSVEALIKADSKVRIIYKEFPILGPSSVELSTVALAVHLAEPSSYKKFHDALMTSSPRSKADALAIAKKVGISQSKIEASLKKNDKKINSMIEDNRKIAESFGISGTPGFIVGEELIPGAVGHDVLLEKVKASRNGSKS